MSSPKKTSFLQAFLASVLGTGLSRVLGAARDIAIAGFLGAGAVSDAFFIAFTIPNTFRRFVADEGLTGALVPAIAQAEAEDGTLAAKKLANSTFTALMLANLVLCGLGMWGAEWAVKAFAWEFTNNPEQFALTVALTRWLFPFTAMVSVVSYCEGLLNHRGHFFVPKIAPGMVSAGIVLAILVLGSSFEEPVYALVAGVLIGGMVHVLINVPPLLSRWGWLGLGFGFSSPRFKRLASELGKVVVIGIFAQVNILVLRQLAASIGDGAVTWYWNANRMVDLSQGIIAVAIGSALLPTVSQAVAQQDWDRFRHDLSGAFRLAFFVLIPTAATLSVFGTPATSMLYRHGRYSWQDVLWTSLTLKLLVPFLLSVAGINIIKKVYFALNDRNTLLVIGLFGVGLTAGLGLLLGLGWGLPGLAAALSLSTVIQLGAYVALLRRRLGTKLGLGQVVGPILRMVVASLPVALVMVGAERLGHWELGPKSALNLAVVGGALALGGLVYLAGARALNIPEYERVVGRLLKRLGRH